MSIFLGDWIAFISGPCRGQQPRSVVLERPRPLPAIGMLVPDFREDATDRRSRLVAECLDSAGIIPHIIELAAKGERDIDKLCQGALARLGLSQEEC